MHVIQAHRKRTGELRDLFTRLLEAERKLFESRSTSWGLQMRGDTHREEDLDAIHQTIDGIEMEAEYLVDRLRAFHVPPGEEEGAAAGPGTEGGEAPPELRTEDDVEREAAARAAQG